jgi:hypothetical protein
LSGKCEAKVLPENVELGEEWNEKNEIERGGRRRTVNNVQ